MEAVFIRVLNISLSAGWMILAVLAARLLLKKAPRWVSVLLWGLVGLRLVMPFSLRSALSLIPSAEVIDPGIGYEMHPAIHSGVPILDGAVNPALSSSLAATPMNSVNPMQILLWLGARIWVIGAGALVLYGLFSYLRLRKRVSESVPYRENVLLCDRVSSPFILGVFRPKIYLPSDLGERETELVLAHEFAHLRRRDHLWKPLGFLILAVHWFNPLVWIAYVLLCRDIEAACDEKVVSGMELADKKAYANALVSCSTQRRLVLACPLAFGEVGVKERVRGVLSYKKPAFWLLAAALMACAVLAVCFLTNPKQEISAEPLRRMTLDDVRMLAAKGDALTWEDLQSFYGEDIGSGLYLFNYPINASFCLRASGGSLKETPWYVRLLKAGEDGSYNSETAYIDIRTEDIDAFLDAQTQTEQTEPCVVSKSDNYIVFLEDAGYYCGIYGPDGQLVRTEGPYTRQPRVQQINESLLRISVQAGTGLGTVSTYYYDLRNDRTSPVYHSVLAETDGMVAYCEARALIVQDIFSGERYLEKTQFEKSFSNIAYPILVGRFEDGGRTLIVTYVSGADYQQVTEKIPFDPSVYYSDRPEPPEEFGDPVKTPAVFINGRLYLNRFEDASRLIPLSPSSSFDGVITTEVYRTELPTENDQSNFGTGFGYKLIDRERVAVYLDSEWTLFASEGSSSQAILDYGSSELYTREDLVAAMEIILARFRSFDGCELHSLRYTSDASNSAENLAWMNDLAQARGMDVVFTQCAEFKSDFHSPTDPALAGAWNVDEEYVDWQWWLAREEGGEWQLMTWGY